MRRGGPGFGSRFRVLHAALTPVATISAPLLCSSGGARDSPSALRTVSWASSPSLCNFATGTSGAACSWSVRDVRAGDNRDSPPALRWSLEATLQGHKDAVCAVAWSPDGLSIVTGSGDSTGRVWRLLDGDNSTLKWAFIALLVGHNGAVHTAAWSPDSARILTGASDGVRAWQADEEGLQMKATEGKNGTELISSFTSRWPLVSKLDCGTDTVWAVEWIGNETRVLMGTHERTGCLQEPLGFGTNMAPSIQSCGPAERARGTTVLRDSYDRIARLWGNDEELKQWKVMARLQDRFRHEHIVHAVAWSPDGERVLLGSSDTIVRIWYKGGEVGGIGKDRTQWNLDATLKGHSAPVWSVAWAPNGSQVLSGARDGVTHIWEPREEPPLNWRVVATLQEIRCLMTADDAIVSVFYGGRNMTDSLSTVNANPVVLDDWQKDKLLIVSALPGADLVVTTQNAQLGDSCLTGGFAISCSNGVDTSTGWEAFGSPEPIDLEHQEGKGEGWTMPCASMSRFHLPGDRRVSRIWATAHPYAVFRLRLATQAARGIADFGKRVADSRLPQGVTASGQNYELLGELQRELVATPPAQGPFAYRAAPDTGHPPAVWSAAWSPDGIHVALGCLDGSVRIWRRQDGFPMQWRLTATFAAHAGAVWNLAWSPDGHRLLSASQDGIARVWRVAGAA